VLVTGAGGAGRTTVAAATAAAAARASAGRGGRTLLLSDEPSAVLEALLGQAPRSAPEQTRVSSVPGLWVARVDQGERFRAGVLALQERARGALDLLGADPLDEDELSELPGADAFALLHALHAAHTSGEWDTVVADLPPAPTALRWLALPAQLRRYTRRIAPPERRVARALRPMLAQLAGVPMPPPALYETLAGWERQLDAVGRMLSSPLTSVRLVTEPGPLAAQALRAARAGLGLHGLPLDAVVANRLLPQGSPDGWLAAQAERQRRVLKELREEYGAGPAALRELPHLGREPRGAQDLERLAAGTENEPGLLPDMPPSPSRPAGAGSPSRPAGAGHGEEPDAPGSVRDRLAEDGILVWRLPLPAARKDELGLVRRGDELFLSVGPYRRALPLPSALRRCRVSGASLEAGELSIRFTPDPAVWPAGGAGSGA
jgi:arsenite-transporting ATPase